MAGRSTIPSSDGKSAEVASLLKKLDEDWKERRLPTGEQRTLLEKLKILGRDPDSAGPIYTKSGIEILARYGFDSENTSGSQEALRCIANALLLRPGTRQILADLGYAIKVAEVLKTTSVELEFLLSRILFYLTYETNVDFEALNEEHGLAESIVANIKSHAERQLRSSSTTKIQNPVEETALAETLKLIFNLTYFFPNLTKYFSDAVVPIFQLLCRDNLPQPYLQPPVTHLINALINLDLESVNGSGEHELFPEANQAKYIERLIDIFENAIQLLPEGELESAAIPVLTLLRRIFEIAPKDVKKYMQSRLLPADEERDKPLGKANSLPARLLNITTSAMTPGLRESVSALLFELSGKDAGQFVENIGYGYASGFLLNHNIPIPKAVSGEQSAAGLQTPVNPITGQRLDSEPKDTSRPMTEEEKEREAERLFVLFERLKKTGIVDVQNPVEKAVEEGRFEELD